MEEYMGYPKTPQADEVIKHGFRRGMLVHGSPVTLDSVFYTSSLRSALDGESWSQNIRQQIQAVADNGDFALYVERFMEAAKTLSDPEVALFQTTLREACERYRWPQELDWGLIAIHYYTVDRTLAIRKRRSK